jgi:hypothetical protein
MKTQEQIEKLRTLQESFDNLAENVNTISNKVVSLGDGSVMLNDVAEGKRQIADAINTKGGESTPDESFQQLAEDIRNIDWNPNVGMVFVEGYGPKTLIEWFSSARDYLLEVNDNTLTELPIGAFSNCPNLHTVNLYALNVIVNSDTINAIVYNNANLKTVYIPLCVTFNIAQGLDGAGYSGIKVLKELNITIPNCTSFITSYMGRNNNYLLQSIIVGSLTTFNNTYVNQQYLPDNLKDKKYFIPKGWEKI